MQKKYTLDLFNIYRKMNDALAFSRQNHSNFLQIYNVEILIVHVDQSRV